MMILMILSFLKIKNTLAFNYKLSFAAKYLPILLLHKTLPNISTSDFIYVKLYNNRYFSLTFVYKTRQAHLGLYALT